MNERERIFTQLQQIGDSIVAMFGKNCETCIHDLTDLHHSLIHINGAVTGREIGAPATDLLVKLLENAKGRPEDLHNYRTVSGDGRTLKSSTIFISDSSDKAIFAFCINFDTTEYFNASQALQQFLNVEQNEPSADSSETLAQLPSETIEPLFSRRFSNLASSRRP